jgi:hypothetical protein
MLTQRHKRSVPRFNANSTPQLEAARKSFFFSKDGSVRGEFKRALFWRFKFSGLRLHSEPHVLPGASLPIQPKMVSHKRQPFLISISDVAFSMPVFGQLLT